MSERAPIRHILLDQDGVICKFFDGALALWGFDASTYPAGEWEIANALGITVSDFWGRIDRTEGFWRSLEPYPWTSGLIRLIEATGLPWTIATSPSRDPQCSAQKVEWMRQHVSPTFTNYMIGHRKNLMAKPDALLIDDGEHNIDAFAAAGGQTILFPQLWNRRGASADPLADVAADLATILGGKS